MSEALGDFTIAPIGMGQGMSVVADIVATYIGELEPPKDGEPIEDWKYRHMAIAVFLHQLLVRSQHKEELAGIVDAVAAVLREVAAEEKIEPAT